MTLRSAQLSNMRGAPRDEVDHRARAISTSGDLVDLQIVNISAMGLMARCSVSMAPGETMTVRLPCAGTVTAAVRWALGGRIGCSIEPPITPSDYQRVLAAMILAASATPRR